MAVVKGDNNFKAIEHNEERMTLVKEARNTVHFIWWYVPPEPYDKRLQWDFRNKNASHEELTELWFSFTRYYYWWDLMNSLWIEDGGLSYTVPPPFDPVLKIPFCDYDLNTSLTGVPKKIAFEFLTTPPNIDNYVNNEHYFNLYDPKNWWSYATQMIQVWRDGYWRFILQHRIKMSSASSGYGYVQLEALTNDNFKKSWFYNVYVEIDYTTWDYTLKVWWDNSHLDGDKSDTYPNWRYWYVITGTLNTYSNLNNAILAWQDIVWVANVKHYAITVARGTAYKWYMRYFRQHIEYMPNYTVRFLNYDNTVLQAWSVAGWTTPTYSWATPTKPPIDEDHFFTFDWWSPTLWPVTHDTDYVAQYKANYLVRFLNYDNTVLQSWSVAEWTTPTYSWETPTKPSDEQYSYTFSWWSPEITTVSWDQTYTAQYTAVTPTILEWDYDFSNNSMTKDEIKALFTITATGSDFNLDATDWIVPANETSSDFCFLTTKNVSTGDWDTIQSIEVWYEVESGTNWNSLLEILSNQNYKSHTNYTTTYDWTWYFKPNISISWATATETSAWYQNHHPSWWQIYIKIDSEWIYWEYKDTHYNHTLTYLYTAEIAQQFLELLKDNWWLKHIKITPRGRASIKNFKYKVVVV